MDANDRVARAGEEAADWWALLQGGSMTREEREAFVDWLRDSQIHIAEMLRLAQVHGTLAHFKEWAEISTEEAVRQAEVIPLPSPRPRSPRLGRAHRSRPKAARAPRRVAFVVALAVTVLSVSQVLTPWREQVITTERGERLEVVLDDGSLVRVDPQTQLRVRFDKSVRRVALANGRAVFHVATDAARPFLVRADGTTVRAVGTAFGVERSEQGVVVTVAEGKVAISSEPSMLPRAAEAIQGRFTADERPMYLTANQQVTVTRKGSPEPVRTVRSDRELAWADGRLVFRNDPVSKVVEEFNRYNRVELRVTDPALAARPITGVFNATNPDALVAFIQNTTPVRIERDAARSIVISSAP